MLQRCKPLLFECPVWTCQMANDETKQEQSKREQNTRVKCIKEEHEKEPQLYIEGMLTRIHIYITAITKCICLIAPIGAESDLTRTR